MTNWRKNICHRFQAPNCRHNLTFLFFGRKLKLYGTQRTLTFFNITEILILLATSQISILSSSSFMSILYLHLSDCRCFWSSCKLFVIHLLSPKANFLRQFLKIIILPLIQFLRVAIAKNLVPIIFNNCTVTINNYYKKKLLKYFTVLLYGLSWSTVSVSSCKVIMYEWKYRTSHYGVRAYLVPCVRNSYLQISFCNIPFSFIVY